MLQRNNQISDSSECNELSMENYNIIEHSCGERYSAFNQTLILQVRKRETSFVKEFLPKETLWHLSLK